MGGKKTLLLLLAGLAILTGLLFHLLGPDAWRLWNVPVMSPSFADIRSILAGVEAQRLGYDPLYQNPLDPFGRVMAYPRLWLILGIFNVDQNDTILLVVIELILFFTSLFIFLDRFDSTTALLMAAFLISPAAMLCYERANNDLVAFFILACALAFASFSKVFSLLLIELAALLKIYPIVALGYLIRESKRALVMWLSGGVAIFSAYVLLTWRDLQQILAMAPKGIDFNYGVTVIGLWILDITSSRQLANVIFVLSYLISYILLFFLLYRVDRRNYEFPVKNPRALDGFRIGALIYIGTFLQGNTWDYRLIFLIFALPQLVEWARLPDGHQTARITLACFLLLSWAVILAERVNGIPFLLETVFSWGLLAGLTYLLFASFPTWIRDEVHRFFEKYQRHPKAIAP